MTGKRTRTELNLRVGRRIKARRDQLGWTAQKLGVMSELSQSYISKLEKGDAGFSPASLYKVAGALATSVDKLLASNVNVAEATADIRMVPVIDYAQAGRWSMVNHRLSEGEIRQTVPINLECPPSTFAMIVRGDSMEPDFHEGDIIIVDPTKTPKPGSYVIATDQSGDATFKKYRDLGINDSGKAVYELVPLNPADAPMRSDRQQIGIVGVLIEHRRSLVK